MLVLSSSRLPWCSVEWQGQRETWARSLPPGLQVIWVQGQQVSPARWELQRATLRVRQAIRQDSRVGLWGPRRKKNHGVAFDAVTQTLHVDVPETLSWMGARLLSALRFSLEATEFDFLLRTNSSTYVNAMQLAEWLNRRKSIPDYCGPLGMFRSMGRRVPYASGTGIGLSQTCVSEVVNAAPSFDHGRVEDVALGLLMKRLGHPFVPVKRVDVDTCETVANLSDSCLNETFLFRCKVPSDPLASVSIMKSLDKRINSTDTS